MGFLPSCLLLGALGALLVTAAGCLVAGHWTGRAAISAIGAAALGIAGVVTIAGSAFPGFVLALMLVDAGDGGLEHTHDEGGGAGDRFYVPIAAIGAILLIASIAWAIVLVTRS